jgi:hypothetical protein
LIWFCLLSLAGDYSSKSYDYSFGVQNAVPIICHLSFLIFTSSINQSISPINKKKNPQANKTPICKAFLFLRSQFTQRTGSGAPSADAVGDATQGLEIGPFWELVEFGRGRDVCADDADGEVGDVCEGDLGAFELRGDG